MRRGSKEYTQCLLGACLLVVYLGMSGCSDIKTEITIPATKLEVWKVLVDTKNYRDWNPVWRPKEGSLQQGAYIKYDFTQLDEEPIEMRFIVEKSVRPSVIEQSAGTSGLFTNYHRWTLEEVEDGTKVIQQESFAGILVLFSDLSWVESSYQRVNEGLRDEVLRRGSKGTD